MCIFHAVRRPLEFDNVLKPGKIFLSPILPPILQEICVEKLPYSKIL